MASPTGSCVRGLARTVPQGVTGPEDDVFEYWHSGWHMWWMTSSWLLGIVIIGLFLWAWIRGTAFEMPPESPEAILKRRYAQGEINSEEYHRRLTELRK